MALWNTVGIATTIPKTKIAATEYLVPVIAQESLGGGATPELLKALHWIDLRVRLLNMALFQDLATLLLINSADFYSLKNKIFKGMFIPNTQMNSDYTINSFINAETDSAFNMYFLQPSENPYTGYVEATPIKYQDFDRDDMEFAIFSDQGICHKNATDWSFAMLIATHTSSKITTRNNSFQIKNAQDNNKTVQLSRGTTFQGSTDQIDSAIGRVAQQIREIVPANRQTDIIAAFTRSLTTTFKNMADPIFLPVIFKGEITSSMIMDNTDPGLAMSLLDIGFVSKNWFPTESIAEDFHKDSDEETQRHKAGEAVDFSLAPYYAKTGYALQRHDQVGSSGVSHYILTSEYNPATNTAHSHNELFVKSREPKQIFNPQLTIHALTGSNVQSLFAGLPGITYSDIEDDLEEKDKTWYHLDSKIG